MLFRTSRKINAVGIDNHTELSVFKAEVRATLAQFGGSDEEWQLRAEILVVTITVAVTLFVISKLGFFAGLALTLFCAAMFCVAYARPFLRFTGQLRTSAHLFNRVLRQSYHSSRLCMDNGNRPAPAFRRLAAPCVGSRDSRLARASFPRAAASRVAFRHTRRRSHSLEPCA